MSAAGSARPPLVSVVVPSYGRAAFVRRAVQSVLAQTYPRVELVVVDDCSPDPVEPHLAGLDTGALERFTVRRHAENRGGNAARNTGIRWARGTYIAFLDDDDRWLPEKLARQVAALEATPDAGVAYTGAVVLDGEDRVVGSYCRTVSGDLTGPLLHGFTVGSFSRVLVRRSLLEAAGLPDERFPNWQDREWYLRLAAHGRFVAVPELLTVHTVSEHDQITDDFAGKRDVALPLFLEKHRLTARERGWTTERRFVAVLLWSTAWTGFTSGHRGAAIGLLARALWAWPLDRTAWLLLALALAGPRVYADLRRLRAERRVSRAGAAPSLAALPTLSRAAVTTDDGPKVD